MLEQNELLEQLKLPFHPAFVSFRPVAVNQNGSAAKVGLYANVRAYTDRLDELCGMDWSVTYTPWGECVICHLTIKGITRSASGEPGDDAADLVAFRRAAAMFGLGRYLLNIEQLPGCGIWLECTDGKFTERSMARIEGALVRHYRSKIDERK